MHSAVGHDELVAALLAAADGCLGPKTEAHLRYRVAQAAGRFLAAEEVAQCSAVSLHNFAQMRCSPAFWAPATLERDLPCTDAPRDNPRDWGKVCGFTCCCLGKACTSA